MAARRLLCPFAALLLLATAGCSDTPPTGTSACVAGVTACSTTEDCGGTLCEGGCCSTARVCGSDSECQRPEHCIGGLCKSPEGHECASTDDCQALADTRYCDVNQAICVGCLDDGVCSTNGSRICNQVSKTCERVEGGCARDTECAVDGARKCRKFPAPGACVACLLDVDCFGGNTCQQNVCLLPNVGCTTDAGCSGATPKCNAATSTCVACLDEAQCGAGKICQAFQCVAAPGCTTDAQCAGNQNGEKCDPAAHACVECLASTHCAPTFVCEAHACVPGGAGCRVDQDCASEDPDYPFCDVGSGSCDECRVDGDCLGNDVCDSGSCFPDFSGCQSDADCAGTPGASKCDLFYEVCVECLAPADCVSGRCDVTYGECEPGCATDAQCAAPSPRCRATDHTCVSCIADADCGAGKRCSANACVAGCNVNADCASSPLGQKCLPTTHACVACLVTADCGAGKECTRNQCVGIISSDGDPACGVDDACAAGTTCQPEGALRFCRKRCNPYVPGTTCAATQACRLIGFDTLRKAAGACVPRNNRGGVNATCTTGSDCERDLACVPVGPDARVCRKLCDPAVTTGCGSGLSCRALPAYYDEANDDILDLGVCIGTASHLGLDCRSDFTSDASTSISTDFVPDCGASMTCAPTPLVLDDSIRVSTCRYPAGTGQASNACSDNEACRSGACLQGPRQCNTSCRWTSDCTRASLASNYTCLPYLWLAPSPTDPAAINASTTGACLPTCKSYASCPADRQCLLVPTFENSGSYQSSFSAYCFHRLGDDAGSQKRPGLRCKLDGECQSGICLTNGRAGATDGYCSGPCDSTTGALNQCDAANGIVCDALGIGLKLNDGRDHQSGTTDDAYGRAIMCVGARCATDRDCSGASHLFSADPAQPRTCQLTLQVNGLNSQYSGTTSVQRTTCEPRVGTAKAGALCAANADCGSGSCLLFTSGKRGCFGGCTAATDCAANADCGTVSLQGQSFPACVPR